MMIANVFPHHQWITAMENWKPIAWTRPWAVQVRIWCDFEWEKEIYLFQSVQTSFGPHSSSVRNGGSSAWC